MLVLLLGCISAPCFASFYHGLVMFNALLVFVYMHTAIRVKREPCLDDEQSELVSRMIENRLLFDHSVRLTLKNIQEIEVVHLGYKLTSVLPPIARLERDAKYRKSKNLRESLMVCLLENIEMFETYYLNVGHDRFLPVDADLSINSLKETIQKERDCCDSFLVTYVNEIEPSPQGKIIANRLLDTIYQHLAILEEARSKEIYITKENIFTTRDKKSGIGKLEDLLILLQGDLQSLIIKTKFCMDQLQLLGEDNNVDIMNEIAAKYTELKSDMHLLNLRWENGSHLVAKLSNVNIPMHNEENNSITLQYDPVDRARQEMLWNEKLENNIKNVSVYLYDPQNEPDQVPPEEKVVKLTRSERIKLQKEKRLLKQQQEEEQFNKMMFVHELKSVLSSRKPVYREIVMH
eukprot:TRINITY_DN9294_c0_g1_i1.p1 TRINITY_DN9294_c0_g1~~TRINITY_DN9294_c0_g1_i1.p1  ORF type:complete len:405 (-),score=80.22 TRINITY_DN9294_c0_g1_i1:207-1421(-)